MGQLSAESPTQSNSQSTSGSETISFPINNTQVSDDEEVVAEPPEEEKEKLLTVAKRQQKYAGLQVSSPEYDKTVLDADSEGSEVE